MVVVETWSKTQAEAEEEICSGKVGLEEVATCNEI